MTRMMRVVERRPRKLEAVEWRGVCGIPWISPGGSGVLMLHNINGER